MAKTSRATRAATKAWRGRSPATSETGGIRVGSSTDNQDGDRDEGGEESGPSSGSGIPITESGNQRKDKEAEIGEGSTNGSYQLARGDSATEGTGPTTHPSGEAASWGRTANRSEATEAEAYTDTSKSRRVKPRRKSDIVARIGQIVRSMYGQLKLQLLKMDDYAVIEL